MTVVDAPARGSDFSVLCHEVRAAGLLNRRRGYYAGRALLLALALSGLIVGIAFVGDSWYQTLTAVGLGVVFTQIAFLGHDAGHQQIFRRRKANDALGLVAGNLLVGLSYGWWVDEHTRHHTHPNDEGADPDIAQSVLAFTRGQAGDRGGILRFIAKYEALLFFPLLTLEGFNLHVSAAQHLLGRKHVRYPRWEKALLAVHLVALLGLPLLAMSPIKALVFVLVAQGVFGVYMGCSFAPNHKGMPTTPSGAAAVDFLRRQVLTSRNVTGSRFVDTLLGGLNYQIEHHLFPSMPSASLRRAQPIVERYCRRLGIAYTRTSLLNSYRIALQHMHSVGAELRAQDSRLRRSSTAQ